jgi:hypothetical protein
LQSRDSSFFDFSFNLLPEDIFGTEEIPEHIRPTPRLKKKTLHMSRGLTINCAVAFGT